MSDKIFGVTDDGEDGVMDLSGTADDLRSAIGSLERETEVLVEELLGWYVDKLKDGHRPVPLWRALLHIAKFAEGPTPETEEFWVKYHEFMNSRPILRKPV